MRKDRSNSGFTYVQGAGGNVDSSSSQKQPSTFTVRREAGAPREQRRDPFTEVRVCCGGQGV